MTVDNVVNHEYSYDDTTYGWLIGINDFTYSRLADSELIENLTRPNNVASTWSYEPHRDLATQVTNGALSSFGYTHDALGRRAAMSCTGGAMSNPDTLSYGYNDRSELISALSDNNTAYNYSFVFDPIGNRTGATLSGTEWTYGINTLNQYAAIEQGTPGTTFAPSYDDDGNMLTRDSWTQTWNAENRLIRAEKGTVKLEFDYDYMGRRIFKKVYDGDTLTKHLKFVYDGYKVVEELDGLNSNAVLRRYVWQDGEVGYDVPLQVQDIAANQTYYYLTDENKNITELVDGSGAVVAHYEYSPFGQLTAETGSYAEANPFRFSSEYHDAETGLVYYNYRYYDPQLGRWLNREPLGEEGSQNLYRQVSNNPVNRFDYWGLFDPSEMLSNGSFRVMLEREQKAFNELPRAAQAQTSPARIARLIPLFGQIPDLIDNISSFGNQCPACGKFSISKTDLLHSFNLTYNPTLGMYEAFLGESYSANEWGRELSTGERVWRGSSSVVESALTAYIMTRAIHAKIPQAKCFGKGTLVLMADGGYKAIEDIVVGDKVMAFDEASQEKVLSEVKRLYRNSTRRWYEIECGGKIIKATAEHPFYVGNTWIAAKDLEPGMKLRGLGATEIKIDKIRIFELETAEQTYNFEVERVHTYFVGESSVLVHNSCKYSGVPDPRNAGSGKNFTSTHKNNLRIANEKLNGGQLKSDLSGESLVWPQKSQKGITPPTNEAHVDHIIPKSKGGANTSSNAQILSRAENLKKGNR